MNTSSSSSASLDAIQHGHQPFAMICRERGDVLIAEGTIATHELLADIQRKTGVPLPGTEVDTISAIPFSQIRERGFEANRGEARIQCLQVTNSTRMSLETVLAALPRDLIVLKDGLTFDMDDEAYAALNARIIQDEIGNGEGANFVVPRRAEGQIEDFSRAKALSIFRSLLEQEFGSYMTFVFHDGERYLIGASPERHLAVDGGEVRMNPISGTYRKTREGIQKADLLTFLRDPKEINELFMVLDEELKMMAQICAQGGEIRGPFLREMSRLLHTEYELVGHTLLDVLDAFRHSMYAPTVVGGPVENACRINRKYDQRDRRYYGSALALLGRDPKGDDRLDSTILIRTMEVQANGLVQMAAGATLVRDSDPVSEAEETTAKLRALATSLGLGAFPPGTPELLGLHGEELESVLSERNQGLSQYHFRDQHDKDLSVEELKGKRITIVTSDDDFSHVLGHMISHMGATVSVVHYSKYLLKADDSDLVIMGPGTGDPNNMHDPKMRKMVATLIDLEHGDKPFMAVCLSHQILCKMLGMPVEKKQNPAQGVHQEISYFGQPQQVGFYNTFAAKKRNISDVDVSFDEQTDEVHALRGPHYSSFQFHPESVLSEHGFDIVRDELLRLLPKQS